MGRLSARTLVMKKDQEGLRVEIDPPDTTYSRDAMESIKRGDLTGMSFAFRTLKDQWDENTDPPTRTVLDMRISEVSLVTFPAYPATDVDVAQRSLNAFRKERAVIEQTYPPLSMRRRLRTWRRDECSGEHLGRRGAPASQRDRQPQGHAVVRLHL